MKSSFLKFALALMALILCVAIMPAALAAEDLTIQLNAEVTLEGTLPDAAESYTIRITADAASNPMPNGQTGGSYDLTVTGAGTAAFPSISFDRLGIYTYTIKQVVGSNADCTYDSRAYQLTVSVINGEKGGLAVEVALREAGKDQKTDVVSFHNAYKVVDPTPTPTAKPTTAPGNITATGVTDMWMYYIAGGVLLLIAASLIICSLRRKEDGSDE